MDRSATEEIEAASAQINYDSHTIQGVNTPRCHSEESRFIETTKNLLGF